MRPRGDLARSQSRRTDPADQLPPVAARQLPDLRGPHRASMVARAEASFTEPELRTSPPRPSLPREDSGASTPHEPSKQSGGSPTKPRGSTSAVSGLPARRQSPATTGVGSSSPYRDDDSTAHSSSTRSTPTKPTSQRRQLSVAKPAFDDDADGSGGSLVQVLRQPKESSLSAASAPPRLARQGGLPTPDITNSSSSFSGAVSPNRWPKNWQQQIASDMVGPSAATAAPSPSSLANPHPNNPRSESGSGSRSSPSPFVPGSGSPSPALTGPGRRRNSSGDGGSAPSRVLPVGTLTLSSLGGRPGLGSARTSRSGSLSGAPGAGDAPRSPASVSSSMGTDTPTPRSILKQPGTQSRHRNDGRRISFVPPVESPDKLTRNTRRDENSGSDSDRSFSDTDSEEDRRESHHRHRRGSKDGSDDDDEGDFDEPSLSYSDTNHAVNHFYHHPGRDESATAPQPHHHHHHQQRYATVPPDEEDEQTIQESDCRRRRRLMDEEREQPPHLSKDDGGSLSPSHSRSPSNEPPSPDRRNPPRPRQGSFEEDDDVVTEPHSRQRPARPQQRQQTQAPLPAALDPRNRRQPRWPTERRGSQEGGYGDDDDDDDDDDPPTEAAGGTREPRGHRRGHERESVLPDKDDSSLDEEENNRSSGGSSYETPQKPTRGPSHDSSASNDSGRRHHHHRRDGSDSRHNSASDDGTASPDSEHRRRSRHRRHHRRHGSSSRSPDSSFSSASSHSSPSRSTAPPPPRQQQQQQHPSGIGFPPLPTSPRQQEEPAMDTSTGSRGRRGEKLRDGPTNTYRGGSGGPSPNGSGIFPHEESSTFLNDPSYTPTNASATPSSGQSRNPSGQTTTLADLTVSALSSVDPSSGLPLSPQQQKQQQQQQALLAAGRRSPSLSSVNSSPTKRKPKQAPAATTQPHAQSGGGEEALSPRASTGSNSNSVGKTSLERQPSTITDREDDRSFQSGSGLPDVAAALPGRDGSAPEREGRQRVQQKKQQPAPADAASNEEQPQHRKRRTSSAKGTNDSENAHKQLRRQHRRHSVAGPDESQRSEGGGSRASSGSRRRRHRSSSRSPGEQTQTADEVGGERPRRRRRSSSAQAGRADPATVDIQPLPKERQHRPRLDRHLANETNSSIRTVELLSAEDAVGGGLVRARGTSPSASHTSPPREAAPQHKEQRELKVRRPRSPAEGQGQGPEEDDESILVDRSQRPPEERDNFEDGYYNFGVPPDTRDETANPHNSRSNSISGGVGADAFEAEAGRKSTPHSRSSHSHSQTSRRSGSNGSSHRHYEHHHKHNHQHHTHSRSSSVSKEESSLSALDAGTGGSKVMRKKLVVVQKKRKKSAAPSADAGTVVQMSLLPIRRASEVLGEDGAKRPLEKLYDHLTASPSSLSRPHSTRERSNGSNSRRSSRGSHAEEKEEKAGGTEGMEEEHTQLDRRSFRRALSAASSRSASRRSSMPPSAMPSAREPRDTDEAGTTMATAHRRPSTASRRHSSSNRSRSHSHSHRHSHRHHPSPSHNAASPMDVTAETAATSRPRRRRHSRRSSGTAQPSAPPHVPSSSAPTYAEGQNDAFYQEMMRNLHQQQRGGHADNDPVDDGTGTSLFDRGPSGITPVNVHVFPHLLSFAGQPQKQLTGGNPMSDDDWPAAVAENRDRAADRHENYGQDNAGVPTFVAMPVIRQKDQFYQAQTGEVPLIDHLLGEGKPKAPLHLTDGTEGEGGEGVEEPLNSFLKVPRSGPTAPPPQLQLQMQQQVARQPSLLYPYRGVAPIQPTPAFAPVIITERADGLSREWQDTLRPSQNKRRRQEEEAMLFGSSKGPAVGAVARARRTPPLSATRNAEREKAYAAAAEFRGAGTGAPPASGQPTSSSDDEEHGKRHNERQSRRGVVPPRRSKGGDAGAAQQGKSQTLPSSTAVVVDGDKKKRRKEAGEVPPLTALLTHSRSNSSSSSDSIPSTISAGGEEGKKSKGESRPDAPRQEGPSVSPHYAPVGPDAGRKKGKQLAKGRAGKTEKADDSESSDGELAGVLSESSPQQHPVDATAATHTPEKQVPQDKKARGQTKGHGKVPPLPPPLPSPSYGVFEPVTEPAAHSRSASSVSSNASLHKKAKHTKAATKDSKKRKKKKGSPRRRSRSQDKKDKLRRRHPETSDEDGEHLETSIAYQLEKIARKRREEEEEEEMERGKAERRARREKEERKREKYKHRSRSRSRSTSHHHRHPSKDKKKANKKADKKDKKKKDKRDKKHKGSRANSTSRYPSVANVFARPSRTDDDSWRGKAESTPRTRSQPPPPPPPPPPPLSSADAARPYSSVYRARAGTPPLRPSSYTPRSTAAWDTDPNRSRSGFGFDDTIDPERERRRANIQKALDDIADRRRGEEDGADRYSRYRRPSSSRYNMGSARRDGGGSRTSPYERDGSPHSGGTDRASEAMSGGGGRGRYTPRPSTRWADYIRGASRDDSAERARGQKSYFADSPPRYRDDTYGSVRGTAHGGYTSAAPDSVYGRQRNSTAAPPPPPTPPTPPQQQQQQRTFTSFAADSRNNDIVSTPPKTGEDFGFRKGSPPTAPSAAAASASVRAAPPPPPPPPGATPISRGESPEEIIKEYEVSDPKAMRHFAKTLHTIVDGLRSYQGLS